jgi:hypothetical protein
MHGGKSPGAPKRQPQCLEAWPLLRRVYGTAKAHPATIVGRRSPSRTVLGPLGYKTARSRLTGWLWFGLESAYRHLRYPYP